MSDPKTRLTVTVDPEFVRAGTEAVASGTAASLSAWVNVALSERAAKERRLRALGEAISAHEAEFGAITAEELPRQERADRAAARVVRGARRPAAAGRRSPRKGAA